MLTQSFLSKLLDFSKSSSFVLIFSLFLSVIEIQAVEPKEPCKEDFAKEAAMLNGGNHKPNNKPGPPFND